MTSVNATLVSSTRVPHQHHLFEFQLPTTTTTDFGNSVAVTSSSPSSSFNIHTTALHNNNIMILYSSKLLSLLLLLLGSSLSVTTGTTTSPVSLAFVHRTVTQHRHDDDVSNILAKQNINKHRLSSSSPSSSTTTTQLNMAAGTTPFKKIFVAGGSRGVGRYVIEKLLKTEGIEEVVALVRNEDAVQKLQREVGNKSCRILQGDAMDYKTVEGAMDGCDAAITTLGGGTALEGQQRVDYQGNNNVIEAAGILGVTRVMLVTSIGCGSSKAAAPPSVFEVLKDVLAAKERAENVLIKYYTNMNWTIIRPGGLKTEAATGKAILTEDISAIGSIHREDVANLIVQALASPKTERKVLSAIDPTLTSAVNLDGRKVEAFALA